MQIRLNIDQTLPSLDADDVPSAQGLEREADSLPASEIPDNVSDNSRDDETDSDNESIASMEEVPADTPPLSPTDCQQWEDDPESTGHDCLLLRGLLSARDAHCDKSAIPLTTTCDRAWDELPQRRARCN